MSEDRTPETVRAEIVALERLLVDFGDWVISIALHKLEYLLPAAAGTLERQEGVAAEQAALRVARMVRLREGLAEELQLFEQELRLKLIPALRNREYALKQELAALEPAEPEVRPLGFWRRFGRFAGTFG